MTTTANLRRTLIAIAEQAMLAFGGDLSREQVSALLPLWRCVSALDDDMRAEVLGRFVPAEPPAVEGKDYLAPAEFSPRHYRNKDGDLWLEYEPGVVKCVVRSGVRTLVHAWPVHLDSARIAYGPLVVVQPDAEAVQQHGIGSADKGSDGLYRRCLCGEEFTGRDLADLAEQIMAHERRVQS
jgi:hypothetical protein